MPESEETTILSCKEFLEDDIFNAIGIAIGYRFLVESWAPQDLDFRLALFDGENSFGLDHSFEIALERVNSTTSKTFIEDQTKSLESSLSELKNQEELLTKITKHFQICLDITHKLEKVLEENIKLSKALETAAPH